MHVMSMCLCMCVIEKDNCKSLLKIYKMLTILTYMYIPENTKCHICACAGLLVRISVRVRVSIQVAFVLTCNVDVFSMSFFPTTNL